MDLNALKIFVKVGELQSFTRAAHALGFTQSGISRSVARLEEDLKISLINRNTHSISLTPDGQFLYAASRGLIRQMDEIEHRLDQRSSVVEGALKITTPSAFGRLVAMPLLADMLHRHPQLTIDTVMSDRVVDIIEDGFDAAIRIGDVEDQQVIARRIKDLRLVTVASPSFVARYASPATPAELSHFNCLTVKGQKDGRSTDWMFRHQGEDLRVSVTGNMSVDNADVLLDAALNGIGLVQVMDFAVEPLIASGKLVEVLPDFSGFTRPLHLIYSPSRHRSPKITALLQAFGVVDLETAVKARQMPPEHYFILAPVAITPGVAG